MTTMREITKHQIVQIQYQVDKPTPAQIIEISTLSPIIGPTATMFLIQAATRCASGVFYEQVTIGELADWLGVAGVPGKLLKTLGRLDRFGIATVDDRNIIIDTWPTRRS